MANRKVARATTSPCLSVIEDGVKILISYLPTGSQTEPMQRELLTVSYEEPLPDGHKLENQFVWTNVDKGPKLCVSEASLCTCIKEGWDCGDCPLKRVFTECGLKVASHFIRATGTHVRCANQVLGRRSFPSIELRWFTGMGIGVVATTFLQRHHIIRRYTGVKTKKKKRADQDGHVYVAELNCVYNVDASESGSFMRFINFGCSANCELQAWTSGGELNLAVVTTMMVMPG